MTTNGSSFRLVLVAGLAVLLAGCASPDVFRKPISDFAAATDKAAVAFSGLNSRASELVSKKRESWALASGIVHFEGCTTSDPACTVTVNAPASQTHVMLHPQTVVPNSVAFMKAMRAYGQALDAVAKADAKAAVEGALKKVLTTASGIATTLNVPVGASLAILSQPLSSAGGWAFGAYQNEIKLEALQRATMAVDPIIDKAMGRLSEEAISLETASLADFRNTLEAERGSFEKRHDAETLKAVVGTAAAMDAALQIKTTPVLAKLAEAHRALTLALQKPKSDPAAALTAIDDFLTVAASLHDSLEALKQQN